MKQKLHLLLKTISVKGINSCFFAAILAAVLYNINIDHQTRQIKTKADALVLMSDNLTSASYEFQEQFDQIIDNNELIINNKNVEYEAFTQSIVSAQYDMKMSGTYIQFIKYLVDLHEKGMLYKIHKIKLKARTNRTVKIEFITESLYEIS